MPLFEVHESSFRSKITNLAEIGDDLVYRVSAKGIRAVVCSLQNGESTKFDQIPEARCSEALKMS